MSFEFLRKYNTATHIYVPIVKRGVVDYAVSGDWSPAAGDVKISKDGGAAANVANLPIVIAMGNGAVWDFNLTAGELQAAKVVVTTVDAATKAIEDQCFEIATFGNASAEYPPDFSDATALGLARLDATIGSRASQTALDAVDDYVDTEVAAIKAKTDNLPASPAGIGDIPSAAANAAAVLAAIVEGTETLAELLRLLRAALVGKSNGFPTGPAHFRDRADAKNRITATVDADGNRTAITTDAS